MSKPTTDEREHYYAPDRAAWRAWLERNHATSPGVWLIYYKQASGKPRVPYDEAVEEALCYGWVDSRPNKLDDERYMQLFSPRTPKSPWSKLNKERVARLIQQGLMTAAGRAVIEAAQRDGSWDAYDAIEALQVPEDLASALSANDTARRHFEAFGASSKKQILWWIASAKREETRRERTAQIVAAAEQDKNPLAYRAKKGP